MIKHQINGNTQHKPCGTKHQLFDSADKLEISRAEAIALCNGVIVSTLLNSNGNLTTKIKPKCVTTKTKATLRLAPERTEKRKRKRYA